MRQYRIIFTASEFIEAPDYETAMTKALETKKRLIEATGLPYIQVDQIIESANLFLTRGES